MDIEPTTGCNRCTMLVSSPNFISKNLDTKCLKKLLMIKTILKNETSRKTISEQ